MIFTTFGTEAVTADFAVCIAFELVLDYAMNLKFGSVKAIAECKQGKAG